MNLPRHLIREAAALAAIVAFITAALTGAAMLSTYGVTP